MVRGEDNSGGAVMTMQGAQVPCTHSELIQDFQLMAGQSATTYIEKIEFLASDVPANFTPRKTTKFTLKMNPRAPTIALQLWDGGLQQGGLIYRFRAVSQNNKA